MIVIRRQISHRIRDGGGGAEERNGFHGGGGGWRIGPHMARQSTKRPAGATSDPELVASAAALPTFFTESPADGEYTMTAGNDDGESAPSAPPVTMTVN